MSNRNMPKRTAEELRGRASAALSRLPAPVLGRLHPAPQPLMYPVRDASWRPLTCTWTGAGLASIDDRVLPLINIVFLLLIFFMVAGQWSVQKPIDLEPLHSTTAAPHPEKAVPTLWIGPQGERALNGEPLGVGDTLLEQHLHAFWEDGTERSLRLLADGRADARTVLTLVESLRALGVQSLDLLTVPPPP